MELDFIHRNEPRNQSRIFGQDIKSKTAGNSLETVTQPLQGMSLPSWVSSVPDPTLPAEDFATDAQ